VLGRSASDEERHIHSLQVLDHALDGVALVLLPRDVVAAGDVRPVMVGQTVGAHGSEIDHDGYGLVPVSARGFYSFPDLTGVDSTRLGST
jgi:hypothetical protein